MWARLLKLPLIVLVMGLGAAAMMVPAAHALAVNDHHVARAFFYFSILFLILFGLIAIATSNYRIRRRSRSHLIALVVTFTVLPVMLAVPFYEAVRTTSYLNSYVEMVSSLTTTGATLFGPERLPPSVHLWRALVGWMGGFFIWLTAVAILAPLNLGGFEVRMGATIGRGTAPGLQAASTAAYGEGSDRLVRFAAKFFPVYLILTVLLWGALIIIGQPPLDALCHAMSTLATSGISPSGGLTESETGFAGEAVIFVFLIFALSRLTFAVDERPEGFRSLWRDPELRLGLLLVGTLPVLLVLRHWLAAFDVETERNLGAVLQAFWGGAFTVMSFLTTTGFESASWEGARTWSGLQSPGLILMGLAVFGGGVATTAGGVKLLRVYALYKHGMREMEKLVHPSSIGGAGQIARRIRREGALVAWVFFMLFALSIAVIMAVFALTGIDFEEALVLTIAALTTTGPLIEVAAAEPIRLVQLSETARLIFAAAMVVGRLETLAIIALLNPDLWRS